MKSKLIQVEEGLKLLTSKQYKLFKKLYPKFPVGKQLNNAIRLIDNTLEKNRQGRS